MLWLGLAVGAVLCLPESVAFSIGFENVYSVGKAVEEGPGETLRTKISVQFSNGRFVVTIRL